MTEKLWIGFFWLVIMMLQKLNRGQVRKGSAEMKRKVKAMGLTALAAVLAAGTCGAEARADDVKTINMYTMGIGNTTDNQMVQDAINEISREKIGVEVNWTVLDIGIRSTASLPLKSRLYCSNHWPISKTVQFTSTPIF